MLESWTYIVSRVAGGFGAKEKTVLHDQYWYEAVLH